MCCPYWMVWKCATCGPQKCSWLGWGLRCWETAQWPKFEHFSHSAHQGHLSWGSAVWTYFQALLLPLQAGKFQALAPGPHPALLCHILEQRPRVRATFRPHAPRPSLSTLEPHGPSASPPTHFPSCPLSGISTSAVKWIVHDMSYIYFIHSLHLVLTQALIRSVCLLRHAWCRARSGAVLQQAPESQLCQGTVVASSCPQRGSDGGHPCVGEAQACSPDCVMVATWVCHFFFWNHLENQLHPGDTRLCSSPETSKVPLENTTPLLSCPVSGLALILLLTYDRVISQIVGFLNS